PAAINARAMSASEWYAAHSRGEEPSLERAFTSERAAISLRRTRKSPVLTAFVTGLSPAARMMPTRKTASDRATTSNRTTRAITTTFHHILPARNYWAFKVLRPVRDFAQ